MSLPRPDKRLLLLTLVLTLAAGSARAALQTLTAEPRRGEPAALVADDPRSRAAVDQAARLLATGDRLRALEILAAAALEPRQATPGLRAEALALAGRAQLQLGQPDLAEPLLREGLQLAGDEERPALAAALLNDLGLLRAGRGDPAGALAVFGQGQRQAQAAGQAGLSVRLLLNSADTQRDQGDMTAARGALAQALQRLESLQPPAERAQLLSGTAARLLDYGSEEDHAKARSALRDALDDAQRVGDSRLQSQALGQAGRYFELRGDVPQALRYTRRAAFTAQAARAPELLYRWEWQAGRLLRRENRSDEALAYYRRALATLQPIRQDLLLETRAGRGSYRATIGPLFTEYADLLLRRSGQDDTAAQRARLVEVRGVIEQLKSVELEDYFRDDCVDQFRSRQASIDRLPPGTAVLYPVVLPDRLELLLSIGSDIQRISVSVDGATLASEALALRRRLEKRSTHEYLPHAQRLYSWLVAPALAQLEAAQVHTLVVAPDGPLLGIPFAAFHDGREFLVRRYAIATIPGLHLVEPRGAGAGAPSALLNGLSASVQGFPALHSVNDEIRDLGQLYRSQTLSDARFTVPEVEDAVRGSTFNVVHIASHGQFDKDPKKSFLLTYDGRMGMDSLERIVKFSRVREEPVDLLTLSACQTAVGDERAALGLAGVAIKAGARSVVATLWYINDEASSALVRDFYRELATGKRSKAQALQAAQGRLMQDARYRHPGYWAPFLVIGNWQ